MTPSGPADDQALVEALPIAAALIDASLTLRRANPAFVRLTGLDAGRRLAEAFAEADRTPVSRALAGGLSGAERRGRVTAQLAGGDSAVVTWQAMVAADGAVGGLSLVVGRTPRTGDAADGDATAAPLDMARVLATAGHDLRQPLQVLAMIHGLLRQWANAETEDLLDDMHSQLATMAEVIDTFLYVDRLEGGALAPAIAPVAITRILKKVASEVRPLARAADLRLRVVATGAAALSDRVLLEQMLRNLVSNAIRYTDQGGVVIGVRGRGAELAIQVVDSGRGIAAAEIDKITRPFYRAAESGPGAARRLGLGLAIVERLAKRLGHRLEVRSTPGRGSTFTIVVPRVAAGAVVAPAAPRPPAPLADLPQLLVGLVEDDARVERVTTRLLRSLGCQVAAATDAAGLLTALAEQQTPPGLLLVDYRLAGDEDGISVIDRVRATLGRPVPAIVVTGDSTPETLRRIDAHGHVHLPKPVDPTRLQEVMRRQLLRAARP